MQGYQTPLNAQPQGYQTPLNTQPQGYQATQPQGYQVPLNTQPQSSQNPLNVQQGPSGDKIVQKGISPVQKYGIPAAIIVLFLFNIYLLRQVNYAGSYSYTLSTLSDEIDDLKQFKTDTTNNLQGLKIQSGFQNRTVPYYTPSTDCTTIYFSTSYQNTPQVSVALLSTGLTVTVDEIYYGSFEVCVHVPLSWSGYIVYSWTSFGY